MHVNEPVSTWYSDTKNVRDQNLIPCWGREFLSALIITNSIHCYIWWPVWSLSLKCMRTCFLIGEVNIMVIRCDHWSCGYDTCLDVRNQGSIPHRGTEFICIANHYSLNLLLHFIYLHSLFTSKWCKIFLRYLDTLHEDVQSSMDLEICCMFICDN